ncbi:hypothetical protein MYXO_00101 [Myxococcaceae bacterium]|nr:hypothetical protein MYXO_00101 [Myxococcaceae bacterium]
MMRPGMRRGSALGRLLGLGFVSALALSASPSVAGATSLADLFGGASIVAEDKVFSNWTLLVHQTSGGATADLTAIDVSPILGDPLNPGVAYSAPLGSLATPFGHLGPSHVSLTFSYVVNTVSQQPLIKDNSLELIDFVFDSGPAAFIQVTETVTDAAGGPVGDKLVIATPNDFPGSGNPNHFDEIVFPTQWLLHVVTRIEIQGPGDNDGAHLLAFEQRFSQVPEPGTAMLVAFGVGGLATLRRRRSIG